MRAFVAFVLCMTFGLFSIVIPPTIFWVQWTYERTGDRNLAWGLIVGLASGLAVGLTAACSIRGFGSVQWALAASIAFVMAVVVGVSSTAMVYQAMAMFPEPLMQAPQGPFWLFHPGTHIGLLSASAVAVTLGQWAGPWKSDRDPSTR